MITRRDFVKGSTVLLASFPFISWEDVYTKNPIMTVTGKANQMGKSLIHEHILVDFIGAKDYNPQKWNRDKVVEKVLPYLKELKETGCETLVDCTPAFLGRDALLLKELSEKSGLKILTNTGYYGAVDNKYLPEHAYNESAQELANRWIAEYEKGIDGTEIRPGAGSSYLSFENRLKHCIPYRAGKPCI